MVEFGRARQKRDILQGMSKSTVGLFNSQLLNFQAAMCTVLLGNICISTRQDGWCHYDRMTNNYDTRLAQPFGTASTN